MIITGNVMIDATALTGPGAAVLEDDRNPGRFKSWAQTAQGGGAHVWMQLNHPGRQLHAAMGQETVAPWEIGVSIKGFSKLFATPRALTSHEIDRIVARFAASAALAERAGFNGVQIHAAHGYLMSQFLSPLTNGPLENRARVLSDVVRAIRDCVSPGFCVAVKLNSADFQRGGFEPVDAGAVISWLNDLRVDLVELSGGNYESPAIQVSPQSGDTGTREAYFLDFARDIMEVANMPIIVTGGIRRLTVAEQALFPQGGRAGISMLGLARAMAFEPELPNPLYSVRRVKARFLSGGQSHPARVAPAGSNRSDEGGDESVEAWGSERHEHPVVPPG